MRTRLWNRRPNRENSLFLRGSALTRELVVTPPFCGLPPHARKAIGGHRAVSVTTQMFRMGNTGLGIPCGPTGEEALALIKRGAAARRTGDTWVNAASSRSHCVFTASLESATTEAGVTSVRTSRLHLVDPRRCALDASLPLQLHAAATATLMATHQHAWLCSVKACRYRQH